MLARSGDFGPAQWWLLSFFCMVNVLSAFHYFAQTFISLTPDVDCEAQDWNCTWYNENRGCRSLTERSGWNFETVTTEVKTMLRCAVTARRSSHVRFRSSQTNQICRLRNVHSPKFSGLTIFNKTKAFVDRNFIFLCFLREGPDKSGYRFTTLVLLQKVLGTNLKYKLKTITHCTVLEQGAGG